MDPELKAYLDGMWQDIKDMHREIDGIRQEVGKIRRETDGMRRDLTEQIVESREHVEQLNRETREYAENLNRETRILVEDVRRQVQLVAENVSISHEKLDRLRDDAQTQIVQLDRRVMRLEGSRSANR